MTKHIQQVAIHIADSYFKAVQGLSRGGRRVAPKSDVQIGIDLSWSDDDFAQFVNLSKDPNEVGNRLVYLINKNKDLMPHECEVRDTEEV